MFIEVGAVWVGLTWWGRRTHPGRGIIRAALVGLATLIVLVPVDLGHALAHIFSARYAGASMDELRLSGGMPRTLYWNNKVSPDVHRMRALGGLVFNLLGCSPFSGRSEDSSSRDALGFRAPSSAVLLGLANNLAKSLR